MEHEIILDTSSILFAMSNRKDIFGSVRECLPSYKIVVSEGVVDELSRLSKSRKKFATDAKAALALLHSSNVEVAEGKGHVDDWIVKEWGKRQCVVCTNDAELKKRLIERGASVVSFTREGTLR